MYPSNSNENAGINLPSPIHENGITPLPEAPHNLNLEAAALSMEQTGTPSQPGIASAPLQSIQSQIQQIPSTQLPVNDTTNVVVPTLASDTDLIEKEWVNRAKSIVENTRDNPYEQSKELTMFKADYMKKRYNKTIKLSE